MGDISLLSIKEPQATLQNKETTVQNYRKMSNQNTKKSTGDQTSEIRNIR